MYTIGRWKRFKIPIVIIQTKSSNGGAMGFTGFLDHKGLR